MNQFRVQGPDPDLDRIRRYGEVGLPDDAQRELSRMIAEVPDAIEDLDSRPWQVRRRALVALSVLAAGVIGGGLVVVPAAAGIKWAAQTGIFGDPETSTEVDDTEWIDLGQGSAVGVVAESYPDGLDLPAGARAADAVAAVQRLYARLSDGLVQQGTIAMSFETWATCAWEREWLDAFDAGDRARSDAAARWLTDQTNFPITVDHDGGGVIDQLLQVGRSAADGDRATVQDDFNRGCDRLLDGA